MILINSVCYYSFVIISLIIIISDDNDYYDDSDNYYHGGNCEDFILCTLAGNGTACQLTPFDSAKE